MSQKDTKSEEHSTSYVTMLIVRFHDTILYRSTEPLKMWEKKLEILLKTVYIN